MMGTTWHDLVVGSLVPVGAGIVGTALHLLVVRPIVRVWSELKTVLAEVHALTRAVGDLWSAILPLYDQLGMRRPRPSDRRKHNRGRRDGERRIPKPL